MNDCASYSLRAHCSPLSRAISTHTHTAMWCWIELLKPNELNSPRRKRCTFSMNSSLRDIKHVWVDIHFFIGRPIYSEPYASYWSIGRLTWRICVCFFWWRSSTRFTGNKSDSYMLSLWNECQLGCVLWDTDAGSYSILKINSIDTFRTSAAAKEVIHSWFLEPSILSLCERLINKFKRNYETQKKFLYYCVHAVTLLSLSIALLVQVKPENYYFTHFSSLKREYRKNIKIK